jgi:hypothetical protein
MSHPEDAAAQALRLAAHALQQISAQSSSSDDDAIDNNPAPLAPAAITLVVPSDALDSHKSAVQEVALPDAPSPLGSPKLTNKLLSTVAQVGVCYGFRVRIFVTLGQGASVVASGAAAIGAHTMSSAAAIRLHTLNGGREGGGGLILSCVNNHSGT